MVLSKRGGRFLPPLFLLLGLTASAREPLTYYIDWFPSAQFAGIYVACDRGYYADAGLDVTIRPFAFGQPPAAVQMDAAPQVAAVGTQEGYIFLQRRAAGLDLRAYTAVLRQSPAGFMTRTADRIEGPKDFIGRKVGIHKFADPLYRWFLKKGGVTEAQAPFVFVGDDVSLLASGKLDVMQGYAVDELVQARRLIGRAKVHFISFRELGFDAYSQVIFATAAQVKAHDKAIRAFISATRRGWIYALAHPPEAVDAVNSRIPEAEDRSIQADKLAALGRFVNPQDESPLSRLSLAKWKTMESQCVEMGLLAKAEDPEAFLVECKP